MLLCADINFDCIFLPTCNYFPRRTKSTALLSHLQTFFRKLPEDGHGRWSKRAAVLGVITKLKVLYLGYVCIE